MMLPFNFMINPRKKQISAKVFSCLLVLSFVLLLASCSYHQRNTHRLVHLSDESAEETNQVNFLYSQQAYGGEYTRDTKLNQYVESLGQQILSQQNIPSQDYKFVIINSSIPNIWSFPKGNIALTRGVLVELKSEAELVTLLTHEIAHLQKGHNQTSVQEIFLNAGPVRLDISPNNRGKDFLVGALGSGSGIVTLKYSLQAEMEADLASLQQLTKMGYSSEGFTGLNDRFYSYHKKNDPHWMGGYLIKHPTSDERFTNNQNLALKHAQKGNLKADFYQEKISSLMTQVNAYQKLDQGYQALLESNYLEAVQSAEQGLDLEPTEAHFYLLMGKAYAKLGYTLDALKALNRAIEINPKYFDNYLQRGLIKEQLDDFAQASRDLETSLSFLPTAEAYYALGEIDYRQEDHRAAIQNFRKASISQSPAGLRAAVKLKELGQALSGTKSLRVEPILTNDGYVNIQVSNMGIKELKNVIIDIAEQDVKGKIIYNHLVQLQNNLSPLESVCHQTNVGPFFNKEHMNKSIQVSPLYSE